MTVDIINDNQRQTIVTTVDHDCSQSCSAAVDHAVLQCQDCVIRELRVLWLWSERRSRDVLVSVVSAPVTAHVPAGAGCECRISWDTPLPERWAAAFFPHFFLHFSSPPPAHWLQHRRVSESDNQLERSWWWVLDWCDAGRSCDRLTLSQHFTTHNSINLSQLH